jgi:hypothetical protein
MISYTESDGEWGQVTGIRAQLAARALSWLLYSVTAVAEERLRILGSEGGDGTCDGRFQLIEHAGFHSAVRVRRSENWQNATSAAAFC